jgi:hypothetical protein
MMFPVAGGSWFLANAFHKIMAFIMTLRIVASDGLAAIKGPWRISSPNLLVLGTHGLDGTRKWLVDSVAEGVFRKVQWPVLMLGPGFTPNSLNAACIALIYREFQ